MGRELFVAVLREAEHGGDNANAATHGSRASGDKYDIISAAA